MPRAAPPRTRPRPRLAGQWMVPLAVAAALAVLVGAALGWAGTRVLVGQSALTTSVASPAGAPTPQLKEHSDSTQRYGGGALGFTASVPSGWEEYRLSGDGDAVSVRFISPDGARELRFDKIVGNRARPAQPTDFVAGLTPAGLGVTTVAMLENSGNQLSYRTNLVGAQGTGGRTTYAQLVTSGSDLWVLRLTVPTERAGDSPRQLLTSISQKFRP